MQQVNPGLIKRFQQVFEAFAEEEGLPPSTSFVSLRVDDPTDVHLAIPYDLAVAQLFMTYVEQLASDQLRVINVSSSRVWFQSVPGRQFYGDWTCLMVRG